MLALYHMLFLFNLLNINTATFVQIFKLFWLNVCVLHDILPTINENCLLSEQQFKDGVLCYVSSAIVKKQN